MLKKIAVVDFDGTLYPGDSMPYIWKRYKEFGFSKTRFLLAGINIMRDKYIYKKILKREDVWRYKATIHMFNLFVGMKDTEIRTFFYEVAERIYEDINKELLHKIDMHKREGYEIVLLSGGFEMLIEKIGMKIGADHVKASAFAYSLDGRFKKVTSRDPMVTMNGAKKASYIRATYGNGVDWQESYAYADNITDSELLSLVGNPIAVNPDDDLRAFCYQNQWQIMSYNNN